MIQSGGWCRLRTQDEHTKLARIGLSFSPVLDEAFKINVAKMRVQLPGSARDEIAQAVGSVARKARETYDRRTRPKPTPGSPPKGAESGAPSGAGGWGDGGSLKRGSRDEVLMTVDQLAGLLMKIATPSERPVIEGLIRRLREALQGAKRS
jgi:hypothetical protein